MAKKPVSITLDQSWLDRVDRLAQLRGETRSAVIERCIRGALPGEEAFLNSMGNPAVRAIHRALVDSPALLKAVATLAGEHLTEEQLAHIREGKESVQSAGQRIQEQRREEPARSRAKTEQKGN